MPTPYPPLCGRQGVGLVFLFIITRLPGMPAYSPLIGVGGIVFFIVISWFPGAARDSGKGDWSGKVKKH